MAEANRNRSKLPPIPAWLVYVIIISVVGSWVPLSLIALARVEKSNRQRIQLFQDMGVQPRIEAQQPSPLFADGRGMRLPVESTVARGELREDDHFYRGYETDNSFEPVMDGEQLAYYDDLPDQIQVSRELLQRGQERFNIACATCHGAAGYGDGLTHRRVQALNEAAAREGTDAPAPSWVPPVNLHALSPAGDLLYGGEDYAAGKLFHVISEGIRTMPAYNQQLTVEDRWAVVAYVKTLQLSQSLPVAEVPAEVGQLGEAIDPIASAATEGGEVEVEEGELQDPELIAQGQQLFQTKICFTCHQVDADTPVVNPLPGPSFVGGIFGEERQVHRGIGGPIETVEVDEAYFVESLKVPQALIVEDFGPPRMMPPMPLTDDEVVALMAYVKSLGTDETDSNDEEN